MNKKQKNLLILKENKTKRDWPGVCILAEEEASGTLNELYWIQKGINAVE